MLGDRSKYCMALSRPCFRTMVRSAFKAGPTCGCACADSEGLRKCKKPRSSLALKDWEPREPSSPNRLSAQARCSRWWRSRLASARMTMAALTQVARVCRLRQLRRRSQSAVKSCCSDESSSGSHWTSSNKGSTLLMPKSPTEVCSPSTAYTQTKEKT